MDKKSRKLFEQISERIAQAATSKKQDERVKQIHRQITVDMPHVMGAFDAWCQSHEIGKPIQAVLCAYILGRNLGEIRDPFTQRCIAEWLLDIIKLGMAKDD